MFEYDPEWLRVFEEEAERLRSVWGDQLVDVHHIGSTAVPGLMAKPIIDSTVVIKDIAKVHDYDVAMISLGYRPRGECLDTFGTPGRFYYSKDSNGLRTHQAHVMQIGHCDIQDKLAFRDYLRAHPETVKEYADLKTRLVRENTSGIAEYIKGKNEFIKDCVAKARGTWQHRIG
jgi:GrpB-like predicted nucleotidyltransferase (UPF0157 family)